MALVEIDPELFIKCRLCIEDNGSYQITPTLLEHIKFCFDIKIALFDGLSQVLCKTCKERLEYFECLKRNIQENQNVINVKRREYTKNEVLTKTPKLVDSSEDVTSTQTPLAISGENKEHENLSESKRHDELEKQREPRDTEEKNSRSFEKNYQKVFVCRYCDKHYNTKEILFKHINSHVDFRRFCRKTLKKHCKVALNRIDTLPNVTGSSNKIVVYDNVTLVQDKNSIDYYVNYVPKKSNHSNTKGIECKSKKSKRKKWRISSDDDIDKNQPTLRKRIRLISNSSSLDTDHEDAAAIDVSDVEDRTRSHVPSPEHVSNHESVTTSTNELELETSTELPQFNYTDNIKNIIDVHSIRSSIQVSYKRYMRLFHTDSSSTDRENMIRRKVLSIGRKVMSKCGIPSNGLLNYCEYNDLPLSVKFHDRLISDEPHYVRVLTKIKDFEKNNSLIGFEKVPKELANENEQLQEESVNEVNLNNNVNQPLNPDIATVQVVSSNITEKEQVVQLLNKTPVANPKQVQKKKLSNVTNTVNSFISLIESDEEEPKKRLPIITATTSMASENKEQVTSSSLPDNSNSLPRIKCKPVTQLMSNTALYNLAEQVNKIKSPTPNINSPLLKKTSEITLDNLLRTPIRLPSWKVPPMISNGSLLPNAAMLVLETDERNSPLPKTKTKYPLDCLKSLLNNYSLCLIDSKTENTEQYFMLANYVLDMRSNNSSQKISVIFKVHFNNFSLKSIFENGAPIDMEKLTPAWQWEILKSLCNYQLSCTIMSHAEKLGNEVYNNCLVFYKVLFSIEK